MSNSRDVPFETTLQVRDTCLCLHTQRAARTLARLFDEALRPVGLTSGQFSLLNALNRPEPPSLGPVAQLLAMDRTTLTAALKPLERDGRVAITADPGDRRNRLLSLTEKGRRVLASAVPIWRDLHAGIEAGLLDVQPDKLRGALKDLSQFSLVK
jgi:DNA-binding MarR family transcriptional regulator